MFLKHAWLPAIAAVSLVIGCDHKPVDRIPTTAPTAIKEPQEVLKHLQYVAIRKDFKDLSVLTPVEPSVIYGSAWWFTKHAGEAGISLTQKEIDDLGIRDLQSMGYLQPDVSRKEYQDAMDKLSAKQIPTLPDAMQGANPDCLDLLPMEKLPTGKPNPLYDGVKPHARVALAAGIYRITKGIPAEMWPDMTVMEVKKDPGNAKVQGVYLGYKGTQVLQVGLYQNPDNTYGISYFLFKVSPKKLQSAVKKAQQ